MSKRAEEAALKAYPKEIDMTWHTTSGVIEVDLNIAERKGYKEGYEQAEKDLALIWGDMQKIHEIICGMDAELESLPYGLGYQEYWKEVLRRYNEWREEQK